MKWVMVIIGIAWGGERRVHVERMVDEAHCRDVVRDFAKDAFHKRDTIFLCREVERNFVAPSHAGYGRD